MATTDKLDEDKLEQLIIAATNLTVRDGLKVQIPLDWIFTRFILDQLPKPVNYSCTAFDISRKV